VKRHFPVTLFYKHYVSSPQIDRGSGPFIRGNNSLNLAEAAGIGATDLKPIEVLGVPTEQARIDFWDRVRWGRRCGS
jgi:hypothetical protein